MVRRMRCRQSGSLSWTRQSWSSPERKSCRSWTRAPSKSWRGCSRLGTRRQSWSSAGGRSMVVSQRWVKKSPSKPACLQRRSTHSWPVLQVEDLVKVEGMTEKRFSSFMKVSRLSMIRQMQHYFCQGFKINLWSVLNYGNAITVMTYRKFWTTGRTGLKAA